MKKQLAMTGDTGTIACAHRLRAAIAVTGQTHAHIASMIGRGSSSISNQVKGSQFPSRELMLYLYENFRIDFNYLIAGSFAQLPMDVQESLFEHLSSAK